MGKEPVKLKMRNLLLVSGDGRDSGKTLVACRAIESAKEKTEVTAVKISSHFHEPGQSLRPFSDGDGYRVFEETAGGTRKDSERMKNSGAERVFYVQATKGKELEAFLEISEDIHPGSAIVCESQSLSEGIEPGVFVLVLSPGKPSRKDVSALMKHNPLIIDTNGSSGTERLPFHFSGGMWQLITENG